MERSLKKQDKDSYRIEICTAKPHSENVEGKNEALFLQFVGLVKNADAWTRFP